MVGTKSNTHLSRMRSSRAVGVFSAVVLLMATFGFGDVAGATVAANPVGYWLLGEDGTVYSCGDPAAACVAGDSGGVVHYGNAYEGVAGASGATGFVPASNDGSPVGDDFNSSSLNAALWTEAGNVLGGATFAYPGGQAVLSVPQSVVAYQPWTSGNRAPTLRQDLTDGDFDVVVVFASTPSQRFQMQGIVVADAANDFLRFDVHWDGTTMRAFAADPSISTTALIDVALPTMADATYLRVTRVGSNWDLLTSPNGTDWTSRGTFIRAMTVTGLGPFVGNANPSGGAMAPAYTGSIDYFGPLPIPGGSLGGTLGDGVTAVALTPTPSGAGYLILLSDGRVVARGDATNVGDLLTDAAAAAQLTAGERSTALSVTSSGSGYWIFTNLGRALVFGDAVHSGDLPTLNIAPDRDIVSSAATAGGGYYMLGADGGVFSFGGAEFYGSIPQLLPGAQLACDVVGLIPTPAGDGYWMVGCDGGVFSFGGAFFVGSVPGVLESVPLAAPVNGIVAYGGGYLMVASDGGAFNFGAPFFGSLGAVSIGTDIVGIAVSAPHV